MFRKTITELSTVTRELSWELFQQGQSIAVGANPTMSRFHWKEIPPLKFLFNLFSPKKKLESPWVKGLDALAERYGEDPPVSYQTEAGIEAENQFKQLCTEVKGEAEDTDTIVVRKERKQNATTSVDLKAWWGGAVATWDPDIDSKNLDSIEQHRRQPRAKWFDKHPGGTSGPGGLPPR